MMPVEPAAAAPPALGTGLAPDPTAAAGGRLRQVLAVFRENRPAALGAVVVVLIVLFCFAGPVFYHTPQVRTSLPLANRPPGSAHPLGTTNVGYDVLGRLMVGGQSSIELGLAVAVLSTVIGTIWGAVAGFAGGLVDGIMMRIVDCLLAIPALIYLLVLVNIFRPTLALLILVLSLLSWLYPARLVRAEALKLSRQQHIESVRTMGGRTMRIVVRHVVPNALSVIIVNATFQVADAILMLAVLSFLGLGLPPPAATWGGMLTDGLNYTYDGYWWMIYPAGAMIVLTVIAFNLVGDGLRDSFDVRLQRR
jgi:peptide/nickel transport system permease protein